MASGLDSHEILDKSVGSPPNEPAEASLVLLRHQPAKLCENEGPSTKMSPSPF